MQSYLKKNKMFCTGVVLFVILAATAWLVPHFSKWSCTDMYPEFRNMGPNLDHLFGTDKFGRDLFVRVFYGARISLTIGIASAAINGFVGICYGALAGYGGRYLDMLLMRTADVLVSIPSMLYVILIMLVVGTDEKSIILGLCISGWIDTARIVRGEVLRMKEQEFCIAARLLGKGKGSIFFHHILPNASNLIIVNLTFLIPQAIFTEAFLGFVGIGMKAPQASLGTLIQASRSQMRVHPYQMFFPTLVLCLLIVSMNLIGEGWKHRINGRKEGILR